MAPLQNHAAATHRKYYDHGRSHQKAKLMSKFRRDQGLGQDLNIPQDDEEALEDMHADADQQISNIMEQHEADAAADAAMAKIHDPKDGMFIGVLLISSCSQLFTFQFEPRNGGFSQKSVSTSSKHSRSTAPQQFTSNTSKKSCNTTRNLRKL